MVVFLLYLSHQAELFPDYKTWRPALTWHIILATWHVTWSLCQSSINRRIGGEFLVYWSVNEHFWCIYLATSGMIFLDFVFRRYKWSKVELCWKRPFWPIKIFCEKRDGHSKRERKKMIALHLKRVFAGTATNLSNKGFFPLNVTWHVTWPVRSTNSTSKCSGH